MEGDKKKKEKYLEGLRTKAGDADVRRKEPLLRKIGKVLKQQSDGKSNKLGLWKVKALLGTSLGGNINTDL